jgi:hypothetical protein
LIVINYLTFFFLLKISFSDELFIAKAKAKDSILIYYANTSGKSIDNRGNKYVFEAALFLLIS